MANYAIFFTFISLLLHLASTQTECENFHHILPDINRYRCKPECLDKGMIEGTTIYSPESSICSAAVHAGVIDPSETQERVVFFTKMKSETNFIGTVRNRRVSSSKLGNEGYKFTSKKFIPQHFNEESWITEVYLIHNNYNGSFIANGKSNALLLMTCLWDSNSTKDSQIGVFRWNHKKFEGDSNVLVNADRSKKRVEAFTLTFNNFRFFNCYGRHPISDVSGIFINSANDKYIVENVSNIGSLGEELIVKMKYSANNLVTLHRFPDNKPEPKKFSVPLIWEKLKETDNALYFAGDATNSPTFRLDAAYFEIIVKECANNKYGESCLKTCQSCENNGVCHPVIGACICRAGFYGTKCEKRCRLDSFGSNCQFSCTQKYLGDRFSSYKKNCLGLTFCLPKPLSCSCAFGYEGFLCNEFSNLTFPYYNRPPSVRLTMLDSEIEIEFEEWKEGVDPGSTFGLQISSYRIIIGNLSQVELPSSKVLTTKENITEGIYYEITIQITLKDFNETQRPVPKFFPVTKVSLPCFVKAEDRKIDVIKQETEILQFSYNIPPNQIDFKGCFFKLTSQSEYETSMEAFACVNNTESSAVFCQFVNLSTGTDFEIDVSCENKIGRCSSTKLLTFTYPNIDKFVTYSYHTLTIQRFANFEETNISVRKLRLHLHSELLQIISPREIRKISEALAWKDDFVWNEEEKMFSFSLEKRVQESEETFYFFVLLETKKQNNEDYHSVSRIFVSSASTKKGFIYIAVFIILILIILVIIFFLRKRIQKAKFFRNIFVANRIETNETEMPTQSFFPKNSSLFDNIDDDMKVSFHRSNIKDIFKRANRNADIPSYENLQNSESFEEGFEIYLNSIINSPKTTEKFYSVPKGFGKSCTVATNPMNKMKNRHEISMPYDDTRVILSLVDNDPYSDYINACLMKGMDDKKWYISTQGPKDSNPNTIGDFWRMVVEAKIDFIIMVANFYEKGKLKVGKYFQEDDVLEFHGISVAVVVWFQHPHFIRSVFQVTYSTPDLGKTTKMVIHYQFTKWPEYGVPSQIFPLVFMIQSLLQEYKKGGIAIHCTDGVQRTGTVLLVLLLKEYQEASTWVDPISVLRNLRETRAGLVENIHQFNLSLLLLYECVYGKLGSVNLSEIDYKWIEYLAESNGLFERLLKQPILHTYTFGERNIEFNRNHEILPSDTNVVFYGKKNIGKNSDYLNSISIDIEDMLVSIIVTEHPLSSTLNNFWKMIFEKKCSYLCLLNSIEPSEEFPSIVPLEEGVVEFGEFTIHVKSIESSSPFSSEYVVILRSLERSHCINVIQFLDWKPEEEYPANLSQLENIVSFVKDKVNSKAPVVVCCSDGVTACGLVTSAVNVINRIDVYQELNIYNSVLRIRRSRPEFLTSKNQFMKIYEVAKLYIEKNASYQNFQ